MWITHFYIILFPLWILICYISYDWWKKWRRLEGGITFNVEWKLLDVFLTDGLGQQLASVVCPRYLWLCIQELLSMETLVSSMVTSFNQPTNFNKPLGLKWNLLWIPILITTRHTPFILFHAPFRLFHGWFRHWWWDGHSFNALFNWAYFFHSIFGKP